MARYVKEFVGTMGRDKGKRFQLTEMKPRDGHLWATRMLLGMVAGGIEMPDDVMDKGVAGLATMAMTAIGKIPETLAVPLLDQLVNDCVMSIQEKATRQLFEDDIEEIPTFFQIQKEVIMLHIAPFISGDPSTSDSPTSAAGATA